MATQKEKNIDDDDKNIRVNSAHTDSNEHYIDRHRIGDKPIPIHTLQRIIS